MKKLILLITVTILLAGSAEGVGAQRKPRYPCAFQKRVEGKWFGQLSLKDANRLRAKSVRVGEPEPVRLREVTRSNAVSAITCVAKALGQDPAKFLAVAKCESGLNPANDSNPTFKGLYQYHPDTWANASVLYGHKGASIFDGYSAIHVTVQSVRDGGWGPWPRCGA